MRNNQIHDDKMEGGFIGSFLGNIIGAFLGAIIGGVGAFILLPTLQLGGWSIVVRIVLSLVFAGIGATVGQFFGFIGGWLVGYGK